MAVQISGNDITVPRDTTVTRNLTVGGVLTYEDVTNVDSIGIVTARAGVLVGSGITLSKDGDIFATGVTTSTTFSGNFSGGTVSGTTGTFSGAVSGTTGTFTSHLSLGDNDQLRLGDATDGDLKIYHDGSESVIGNGTGTLQILSPNQMRLRATTFVFSAYDNSETLAEFTDDGAVQLYHNNERKIYTKANGAQVEDTTATGAYLTMATSSGTAGHLYATTDQTLGLLDGQNHYMLKGVKDGSLELYYDNTKTFETVSGGAQVIGNFTISAELNLTADGNKNRFIDSSLSDGEGLHIRSTQGGDINHENMAVFVRNGKCELYYDNVASVETTSEGLKIQKTASGATARLQIESTNGGQAGIELRTSLSGTNRASRIDMYNQDTLQWTIFNDYQQSGTNDFSIRHGAEKAIVALPDGAVELYHDDTQVFKTSSTGFTLVGDKAISLDAWQGRLDRLWSDYPSISISPSTTYGTQSEFRVHGINGSLIGYGSGGDFSIDFRIDGTYQTGSDQRRKTNIEEITGALDTVKQLTGKKFNIINRSGELDPNKGTQKQFGLIAQECKDIIPEVIKFHPDEDTPNENGWASAYGLDYSQLTPLLINAVKELSAKNDALETRIAALEG